MGRPAGMPNLGDLIGESFYAENHRWFCMVRPRSQGNLSRWVSVVDFEREDGAETYWSLFKADTARMTRDAGKVFALRFFKIPDAKPPEKGVTSSEGITFHVEHLEERWRITVVTQQGRWVSKDGWTTRHDATRNRIGYRASSNRLRGHAWTGWLNRKFDKEESNGKVEE